MAMPARRTAKVAWRNEGNWPAAVAICSRTWELKPCSSRPSGVRRGEKVPATVGTVSHRFGLLDGGPLGDEGPGGDSELAEFPTIRAGKFGGQLVGLLLEQQLQG